LIQDEIEGTILKIEKQITAWTMQISLKVLYFNRFCTLLMVFLKVQRDIRVTLAAGDFLTRSTSKSVGSALSGAEDLQRSCFHLDNNIST
jgi:hypothetical protein